MFSSVLIRLSLFGLLLSLVSLRPPQKIPYYGARFEPRKHILHGAGQASVEDFRVYTNTVGKAARPMLFMDYAGVGDKNLTKQLRSILAKCQQFNWYVIPQIGLSMTNDGKPELHYEHEVAAGQYDLQLDTLVRELKRYGRPVYLRIGYEFNGSWNGYQPESYRQAFRRVRQKLEKGQAKNVATVWCFGPTSNEEAYLDFYPGDDVVDWWGIDVFTKESLNYGATHRFIEDADAHRKPVMIGESTPKFVGVGNGEASWNAWFAPYFGLMSRHANIKAFCYINWNWAKYDYWKDWGDGRIGGNEFVKTQYQKALKNPRIAHGRTQAETLKLLR